MKSATEEITEYGQRRVQHAERELRRAKRAERELEDDVVTGRRRDVTAAELAIAREEVRLATLRVEAAHRLNAEEMEAHVAQAQQRRRRRLAREDHSGGQLASQLAAIRSGAADRHFQALCTNGSGTWSRGGKKPFPTTEAEFFTDHPDHPEAAAWRAANSQGDAA
jgi:hypothetical protein